MKRLFLLLICACLTYVSCQASSEGITQAKLRGLNCQSSDVDTTPPFMVVREDTAVPDMTLFAEQITAYHSVRLAEMQLSYTDVECVIVVYGSAATAVAAWEMACANSDGEEVAMTMGEAACGFDDLGIRQIHFQRGTVLVTIWEDSWGMYAEERALAVDGRLP